MMTKSIPNLLSGFRLIAAPFLLGFAWTGHKYWFLGTLAASLLSDVVTALFPEDCITPSGM